MEDDCAGNDRPERRMTTTDPPVLRLSGEIDAATARELNASLNAAVGTSPERLVVDLTDVTFIDSTGLGALLKARAQLENQGAAMVLVCTREGAVARLIDDAGVGALFVVERR